MGAKITRLDIAQYVHLSEDHLNRLFKKMEGTSLIQYVINEKMKEAARQIIEGQYSIGEIAQRLGYDNFSYFSNLFKKNMGMTATEYKHTVNKPISGG